MHAVTLLTVCIFLGVYDITRVMVNIINLS